MIFYHYTAIEYLDAIMDEGLSRGDGPTSARGGKNGVWLTTDHDPTGHGLSDASNSRTVPVLRTRGLCASPSRSRAAIGVLLSGVNGAANIARGGLFDSLNKSGGGKHATWFIYFGIIAPDRFSNIEFLQPPELIFAVLPDGSESLVRGSGILKASVAMGRTIQTAKKNFSVMSQEEVAALEMAMHRPAINPFIDYACTH